MVEYLTKEEVMGILDGLKHEQTIIGNEGGAKALSLAEGRINALYTVRPVMTATWKTIGYKKDVIYCGRCGFKTLSYKKTAYCPECGRKMLNGRATNDQG